jgi:hypothetical protein
MHDGEGRHGRSRPYTSLAGRVLIGALLGAFLGLLELWFIGSGSAPSLAVMAADPNVASASGVSLPWAAAERFQEIVLCTSAGSVAYTVWWLIEQPGTSIGRIALAVGAGALLGALFTRTSENTPLPLCVSFRHVSWTMPMRAEDGLRMPAARDGFGRIAPRSSWRPRPLIEISDVSR